MKKILTNILALAFITNTGVAFSACEGSPVAEQRKLFDPNGVWQCQYVLNSKTECELGDWTQEYKKEHEYPDYIFFPSYIGDIKVVQLGYTSGMATKVYRGEGKIFVPHTVKKIEIQSDGICQYMIPVDGVEFFPNECYVPEEFYQSYVEKEMKKPFKANIEYHFNYQDAENKYYCVDNYNYTTEKTPSHITIIPPQPEREGYTFGGWYKEAECINEWDFKTDTLPKLQTTGPLEFNKHNEENVVFQKTALYAKWI